MNKKRAYGFIVFLVFYSLFMKAQNTSNEGTDFYAVFPTHIGATNQPPANYTLFITGKQSSFGTVSVGSFTTSFNVAANGITQVEIPRNQAYIVDGEANRVLTSRAIHIQVNPGQPKVVVYGHIYAGRRSAASLILPVEAMGQRYYSMNITNVANGGGDNFIVLVATEASTRVFLRRNGLELVPGGVLLNQAGDVYEYLDDTDLTGTEIVVDSTTSKCKRFAVFSGSTNVVIEGSTCDRSATTSSDPLYQQNYPVENWGSRYGFVSFSSGNSRLNGNLIRVLAKEPGTEVQLDGSVIGTLGAGEFVTVQRNAAGMITSNKPVAVAQYALSQRCAGGGFSDADMVILNPVEYSIKDITLFSSTQEIILEQYVNVVIPTTAAASFRINGVRPGGSFSAIGTTGYSFIKMTVTGLPSTLRLTATEGFNAIAYGFGDYESYAYSAGTNLASVQKLTAFDPVSLVDVNNACTNEDSRFRLQLKDKAQRLTWYLENEPAIVDNSPLADSAVKNGTKVYSYLFPGTRRYSSPGIRTVKVFVLYPPSNTCFSSEQEIELTLDVFYPPKPSFTAAATSCPFVPVAFEDKSDDSGQPIISWYWDFGDGVTSTAQNPTHTYTSGGTYTVSLSVQNGSGCVENAFTRNLIIRPIPLSSFTASAGTCANREVTFTDTSAPGEGSIVSWAWDFGDGTTLNASAPGQVVHTFPRPGTYTVSLRITNSSGCQSQAFANQVIVFTPFLEAGPDRMMLRGGEITLAPEAYGTALTYRWTPSTGLDRDDIARPTARPIANITYTLTITSAEGCVLSDQVSITVIDDVFVPNTFTPNGDGINDTWNIPYLDTYPSLVVSVFNRMGTRIYSSAGYAVPWDGTYLGEKLPVGTYYYTIQSKLRKTISGYVTLIR